MNALLDLTLMNRILRAPAEVAADCRDDLDSSVVAKNAIVAIVLGSLLFGAAVGSWQGASQALLAAAKLPIVMLGTLALSAPAFYAVSAAFHRPWSARTVLSLLLVAGARFSLVLLAATPALWLAINLGASYDVTKLVAAAAYAVAGLFALAVLLHGLGKGPGWHATIGLFIGIFLLVGAQTSWILRPYIGHPRANEVVYFTREREGGLVYQLWKSVERIGAGERYDARKEERP